MTFFRIKRVGNRDYVYEMKSYRDAAGEPRNRIIRYVGPVLPRPRKEAVDVTRLRSSTHIMDGRGEAPKERRARKQREREAGTAARP